MQSEALILEAHHSTHIEGTQLTLPQAQRILTGKSVKGVRKDDRQEPLNYKEPMAEFTVSKVIDSDTLQTPAILQPLLPIR